MRLCSCVCRQWNHLISDCKRLYDERESINVHESIILRRSFYSKKTQSIRACRVSAAQNKVVVYDCNDSIVEVFSVYGNFICSITLHEMQVPQFEGAGKGWILGDRLFVADRHRQRVQIFDFATLEKIKCIFVENLKGVCCTDKGNIIVSTSQNNILILDKHGQVCKKFGSAGRNLGQFIMIEGICCNSKDEILALDCCNHRVQIFSQDGEFLRRLGSEVDQVYRLNTPEGICVDGKDNIIIADYSNDRVCILTPEGSCIQEIKVCRPVDVCLMGKYLIVTGNNNWIGVYSN